MTLPEVCRVLRQYDVMWKLKQFSKKREKKYNSIHNLVADTSWRGHLQKKAKSKKIHSQTFRFFLVLRTTWISVESKSFREIDWGIKLQVASRIQCCTKFSTFLQRVGSRRKIKKAKCISDIAYWAYCAKSRRELIWKNCKKSFMKNHRIPFSLTYTTGNMSLQRLMKLNNTIYYTCS